MRGQPESTDGEIFRRLGEIERLLTNHSGQLDTLVDTQKTHTLLLTGNGTPDKGMVVRLDRLERLMAAVQWVLTFLSGAVVAVLGSIFKELFHA